MDSSRVVFWHFLTQQSMLNPTFSTLWSAPRGVVEVSDKRWWKVSRVSLQLWSVSRGNYMGCNTILRCGILGVLYSRLTEHTIPIILGTCYAFILLTDFPIVLDAPRVSGCVSGKSSHRKATCKYMLKSCYWRKSIYGTATGMAQILMSKCSNLDHLMRFSEYDI